MTPSAVETLTAAIGSRVVASHIEPRITKLAESRDCCAASLRSRERCAEEAGKA